MALCSSPRAARAAFLRAGVAIGFVAWVLSSAPQVSAKLPELDAVYWGTVAHNGNQVITPGASGQVLVIARAGGVIVAQTALPAGQSTYVLKVPLDDGVNPRIDGTLRFGETIKVYVRNVATSSEYEASQTRTTPFSISSVKGDVQVQNLSIPEDLGAVNGIAGAYAMWRLRYPGLGSNPNDGALDRDGDGVTNFEEFVTDTDPTDPKKRFRIIEITRAVDVNTIRYGPVRLGRLYEIFSSPSLTSGIWTKLGEFSPSADAETRGFDHLAPAQQFYRVQVSVQ